VKILILGVNGFIGSHLSERLLADPQWEVTGFDLAGDYVARWAHHPRFTFRQGDIFREDAWLAEAVAASDVVFPLAGVAKPALYVKRPLYVYELDYEQNVKIARLCAEHGTRIIFPSTSEVYGMSPHRELKEDESPLVLGPIAASRWIYSCSKQMMDRVLAALGQERGLRYSCFRPFNWMGPRLDTFDDAARHEARAVTQMLYDMIHGRPVVLVNGGAQRRSFTHVDDGIDGLLAILTQEERAQGQIFNLGNPDNNASIRELALAVRDALKEHPAWRAVAEAAVLEDRPDAAYYGPGYEDVDDRRPSVAKARELLGWVPRIGFTETVRRTVASILETTPCPPSA